MATRTGLLLFVVLFTVSSVWAAEPQARQSVAKSADGEFLDYGDGTIYNTKTGLMWMKQDFWQMNRQWVNWYTAVEFVRRMNNKKFGGYTDWRLPTPAEAGTLYDPRKRNLDKDGDKIHIDPLFPAGSGWSTWTSEEKKSKAVVVSYKGEGGKEYQDKIEGTDAFLRLVRGPMS
ncbi:MAG: hypothetical protein COV67_13425 [Nitrospinae bacterium CG11_big_fil_rev_8_21_14_0_20_56_8]|nr:MAG: hypothetical protein COV67_13425 [Nitrospinae bacterium CG11_big_fil_rev_8_21_14_0_20_56_8]